ncbi:alpha-galactosidase, partial [Streptomyces bacillaris]|uniref:alpha-galactosidase n=1 Tax=Streptomyces bacillaris TaxID=68179 RepID=UPI0036D7DEF9
HVGAERAHTTGRHADLPVRMAVASLASAGIEWNLTDATSDELGAIREWLTWYKSIRGLLSSGTTVRPDPVDDAVDILGIVSAERDRAVFQVVCVGSPRAALPAPLSVAGLDDEFLYRVSVVPNLTSARFVTDALPPWMESPIQVPGSVLRRIGLPLPPLTIGDVVTVELSVAG